MLVKKLTGKEVIGAHGEKIGKVTDFDIDIVSGKVKAVLIGAGFNKTYKIKMDDIITVGDAIIIRLSESDLKQAATRREK
jgi:sporulation protein YlmC with PRC-barrel domain